MRKVAVHVTHAQHLELYRVARRRGCSSEGVLAERLCALSRGEGVTLSWSDWVDLDEEDDLKELVLELPDDVYAWVEGHVLEYLGVDSLCRRIAGGIASDPQV